MFTVDATTGEVTLTADPDYEALSSYHFTVVVEDAAGNKSEQAVSLAVNVVDTIAPVLADSLTIDIMDTASDGDLIYQVTATDTNDRGRDTTPGIIYSFTQAFNGLTIDASTGEVRLAAGAILTDDSVDRNFAVYATDKAGNYSYQSHYINVLQGVPIPAVAEQTGGGESPPVIYSINDGKTYTLKAGSLDAAQFRLDAAASGGYDVVLIGALNYELKRQYAFFLADPSDELTAFVLPVTNVDEVAPSITSDSTATAIMENSGARQVVYTAVSTDTEDVATGSTTYSLKAGTGDATAFSINTSTGEVTLTADPNYETKASYSFTVVARDAAGNASEKAVTLAINNVDEQAPQFSESQVYPYVTEKTGAGQVVHTATTTDVDYVTGSTVYSIKQDPFSGDDAAAFSIDPASGAVTLTANPDAGVQANYIFTVVATDAAQFSSEQIVRLSVMDVVEKITWSTKIFVENAANRGAVDTVITLTLENDTFTGSNGRVMDATFTNVPEGLTAVLTKTSDTTAALTLTGKAYAHANVNDTPVNNPVVATLADSNFTATAASRILAATVGLTVDFRDPDPVPPIQLSALAASVAGFVIKGDSAARDLNQFGYGDSAGYSVSGGGDINGDGLDDLIIGTKNRSTGITYVVFGKADQGQIDLAEIAAGTGGFAITGDGQNDNYVGSNHVRNAGDVNGDGLADLIIGAPLNDGFSSNGGRSFVVFGKTGTATVDLMNVVGGVGGFVINGQCANSNSGGGVAGAGDVNGDGLADLIVSASGTVGAGSFVVFGQTGGGSINLSAVAAGTGGFRIGGGISVSGAGDVNGDGLADLIVGAPGAQNNDGRVYLVLGKADTATVAFTNIENGNGGFVINGAVNQTNSFGQSVSGVGDINGDGLADLVLADQSSVFSSVGVRRDFVVFGKASNAAIDVTALAAGNGGFLISGVGNYGVVSGAGDINGDGLADLIISAPTAGNDGSSANQAGLSYVVFGQTGTSTIDLVNLRAGGGGGFVIKGQEGDWIGMSVSSAGDVNGDGLADLLVGATGHITLGEIGGSYVIFGATTGSFDRTAVDQLGTSSDDTLTGSTASESLIAGAGNDTLIGAGGADVLYGGAGNDTFVVNADNVAKLAAGPTSMLTDADNPKQLARIDGGNGIDTLKLDSASIDLTLIANQAVSAPAGGSRIESIERIDMTGGGNNTVTLALKDVLDMAGMNSFNNFNGWADGTYDLAAGGADFSNPESRHQLVIDGDAGDVVSSSGWGSSVGTVSHGGVTYNVYNQGLYAQLLIDTAVTQSVL